MLLYIKEVKKMFGCQQNLISPDKKVKAILDDRSWCR